MTIKKNMTVKRPTMGAAAPASAEAAANSGAATIADRFKLDAPDPKSVKKSSGGGGGPATTAAVIAAVIALIVSGILTFVMYQHWEFLKGA